MNWRSLNWRTFVAVAFDLVAAAAAWFCAYLLRFNFEIPSSFHAAMMRNLIWVVPLQEIVAIGFGLYRGLWRFASIPDLRRIALAVGTAALAVPTLLFMLDRMQDVPRSVLALDPMLLLMLMGGSRILYRAWKDEGIFGQAAGGEPVLVVGAGDAAAALLRDLQRTRSWRVMGLLDDNRELHGRRLNGINIIGSVDDIAELARRTEARHVIIAMPAAAAGQRRRAAELAAVAGLTVLTVPGLDDLLSGRVTISNVRKVELEDLLGREPVQLDEQGLHGLLTGQVVLITGAGGSIGSELSRQIARFGPARMVLYEASELALYSLEQEFLAAWPAQQIHCVVGDVRDAIRLENAFTAYRPQVVFHAAAYKHVPLMETENAWEAVRNNVFGTLCVARAAQRHGARKFVLVSTDKAVNPTSVMGASKRLAEQLCRALEKSQEQQSAVTRFVMVRFGNVLGSSGSVVPKFRRQIAQGGPVTVTHPDMIRYFMLIPEAAQLVLQAGLMGNGGEIFVLDMGEPVKIVDLARDMIRLSGFTENEIAIEFTGLRPGEKLFEELLADSESTLPTPHPKLRVAKANGIPDAAWLDELECWLGQSFVAAEQAREELRRWVPEYRPSVRE